MARTNEKLFKPKNKKKPCQAVVAHTFNPSTWEAEAGASLSSIESNLVYKVSSRTARATQRNPVSKQNKAKQKTHFIAQ